MFTLRFPSGHEPRPSAGPEEIARNQGLDVKSDVGKKSSITMPQILKTGSAQSNQPDSQALKWEARPLWVVAD